MTEQLFLKANRFHERAMDCHPPQPDKDQRDPFANTTEARDVILQLIEPTAAAGLLGKSLSNFLNVDKVTLTRVFLDNIPREILWRSTGARPVSRR